VPNVACFDTAFHVTLPPAATTYALPTAWRERRPLRRYGFHGLSHGYAARRAGEPLNTTSAELRAVTCHLGAGASLTAQLLPSAGDAGDDPTRPEPAKSRPSTARPAETDAIVPAPIRRDCSPSS
jgi:acetate kinase